MLSPKPGTHGTSRAHQRLALMTQATRLRVQLGSSSCPHATEGCDLFPQCRAGSQTGRVQLLRVQSSQPSVTHRPSSQSVQALHRRFSCAPHPWGWRQPSWGEWRGQVGVSSKQARGPWPHSILQPPGKAVTEQTCSMLPPPFLGSLTPQKGS